MTRILLCAGPTLLVIDKDGVLFYRRPGQSDVKIPYTPRNYQVFLHSAKYKYDLSRVIGPDGGQEPAIPDEICIPELRSEQLSTGETVYRVTVPTPVENVPTVSGTVPATPAKESLASY